MAINLYSRKFTVFLADVSTDLNEIRSELTEVLFNANITLSDDIKSADCSIHILGESDIYSPNGKGYNTSAGEHFRKAKTLCNNDFKMFVWNPKGNISSDNSYINNIRRDIVENSFYSDKPSPIIFVEDIRYIMNVKQKGISKHEPSDIFFLYNELDNDTANGIYNMLRDFVSVQKLGINMSSGVDYNTYINEQLSDSKIGVVYYDYAGDWAVPFARQIWKDSGGNSSKTPITVIGNTDHAKTEDLSVLKDFMECNIDDKLRIPLDIKVFLDKKMQS